MHIRLCVVIMLLTVWYSCGPEPAADPQKDCALLEVYTLGYHFLRASQIYDLQSGVPVEIKNGVIEYKLSQQSFSIITHMPSIFPCAEYFIDTIHFPNETEAIVKVFELDFERKYDATRNDCKISLASDIGDLSIQLASGGNEITASRYAIYEHLKTSSGIDTFHFLAFRTGAMESYDEIITQFAADYPGLYDTVAIEEIVNSTD